MTNPPDPNAPQQPVAPQQPAPQYAAPQYTAAPARPTNTMSIISMIASIVGIFTFGVLCILGIILGHISLSQIKRTGENVRGMSITGLIVGYIGIAGWIIGLLLFLALIPLIIAAAATSNSYSY